MDVWARKKKGLGLLEEVESNKTNKESMLLEGWCCMQYGLFRLSNPHTFYL